MDTAQQVVIYQSSSGIGGKAYGDWAIGEVLASQGFDHFAEEWIDGTRGYGAIDYSVLTEEVLVLVQKVKKYDFEKGTTQTSYTCIAL
ncbi:1526_t:CDS:2 [Ambispora gerdemannii]|uniref:1526_t:CDS:1 n=1 Tax=Ambispora gerdemannii TaxID=144530 RepID=A0A9N9F6U8_9GLOM|nr:1526_t:CDS:2 [Ambispora gerdemannii]